MLKCLFILKLYANTLEIHNWLNMIITLKMPIAIIILSCVEFIEYFFLFKMFKKTQLCAI